MADSDLAKALDNQAKQTKEDSAKQLSKISELIAGNKGSAKQRVELLKMQNELNKTQKTVSGDLGKNISDMKDGFASTVDGMINQTFGPLGGMVTSLTTGFFKRGKENRENITQNELQNDNAKDLIKKMGEVESSTKILAASVETKEEKNERLRRETSKDKGGEVIKLEGAEDTSGFSLMDIFSKGGRGKLLGSLATGLTGIASFAFSKEGGLFSAMKGVNFGKVAGAGMLAGGLMMMATDGLKGITKAKAWGVGTGNAAVASALGGVDSGVKGMFSGAGKWALMGAAMGSFIPGIGTLIGGLVGGLIGAVLGYFGGERIANFFKDMQNFAAESWNKVKGIFGKDDPELTKIVEARENEEKLKNRKETIAALEEKEKKGTILYGGKRELKRQRSELKELQEKSDNESKYGYSITNKEREERIRELQLTADESNYSMDKGIGEAEQEFNELQAKNEKRRQKRKEKGLFDDPKSDFYVQQQSKSDAHVQRELDRLNSMKKELQMLTGGNVEGAAKGGFIVNKPTYLPGSGVMVGDSVSGATRDGGSEAVIPLNSPQASAFIDPMARSVAGSVMNRLQMEGMSGGAGGSGASVVTGNDMSSSQTNNSTTVINNPSPIGQMLPDEGRSFVSKVA